MRGCRRLVQRDGAQEGAVGRGEIPVRHQSRIAERRPASRQLVVEAHRGGGGGLRRAQQGRAGVLAHQVLGEQRFGQPGLRLREPWVGADGGLEIEPGLWQGHGRAGAQHRQALGDQPRRLGVFWRGDSLGRGRVRAVQRRRQPVAALGYGFDVAARGRGAEGGAQPADRRRQRIVADRPAAPDRGDDLVLGQDPAIGCGEQDQEIHQLRLDAHLAPEHRCQQAARRLDPPVAELK